MDRGREPDLFRSGASAWGDRDGVEEPVASARHSGGVREQGEAARPVQVTAKRSKLYKTETKPEGGTHQGRALARDVAPLLAAIGDGH